MARYPQRFSEELLAQYEKAPDVTRERLYLDAVESVMSSTSKVFLDADGSNSLMYLPLDKLIQGRDSNNSVLESLRNSAQSDSSSQIIDNIRNRTSSNSRTRETR